MDGGMVFCGAVGYHLLKCRSSSVVGYLTAVYAISCDFFFEYSGMGIGVARVCKGGY